MTMKPAEAARITTIILESSAVGRSIRETVRLIHEELPHLPAHEVAEVADVCAEVLQADGVEMLAGAEASKQVVELLLTAGQLTGITQPTLGNVMPVLTNMAAQGNEQAADLLARFEHVLPLTGLGDECI
jgi:hypothetical protein